MLKPPSTTIALLLILLSFSPLASQNLVTNGSFEDNFTNWTNLVNDGAVASFNIETVGAQEGAKAMKVSVTTLGTNSWSIQSIGSTLALQNSKLYTLTFYAKAINSGSSLRVVIQNSNYQHKDFQIGNTWQQYSWTFTATETSPQFKFHFFQAGTFFIDNISIPAGTIDANTDILTLDPSVTYQTMEGFGAALAFYEGWVTAHPNKESMYSAAFNDLGLEWLRIRNDYRYQTGFNPSSVEFVSKAKFYSGNSTRVLMCSWSPPANLKSNNSLNNGTLKKVNGSFVYNEFAQYWRDALVAYNALGVNPDWISIQNEPDWLTDQWETCKFLPTETVDFPGYNTAFDSVYNKIKGLSRVPKLLGAEPLGIGYNTFNNFHNPLKNKTYLHGYNYHLYHGGDPENPDSYNTELQNIAVNFANKPNMMTEYEHAAAGWFKSGWLINNVLSKANASAYFYWDLIWPDGGLIDIDNPWDKSLWENNNGFELNPMYFMFKHYSKNIRSGYKRMNGSNSNSAIRTAAFISPDRSTATIVIVNTSSNAITTSLQSNGWPIGTSTVIQSAGNEMYKSIGSLSANNQVILPASSITTVLLNQGLITDISNSANSYSSNSTRSIKSHCFPNPFDNTIKINHPGKFDYYVLDITGRILSSGQGDKEVLVGETLEPGTYLINIVTIDSEECFIVKKY